MKRCFKARGPAVVEKKWIEDGGDMPEGWFATPADAMAKWKPKNKAKKKTTPEPEPERESKSPRGLRPA